MIRCVIEECDSGSVQIYNPNLLTHIVRLQKDSYEEAESNTFMNICIYIIVFCKGNKNYVKIWTLEYCYWSWMYIKEPQQIMMSLFKYSFRQIYFTHFYIIIFSIFIVVAVLNFYILCFYYELLYIFISFLRGMWFWFSRPEWLYIREVASWGNPVEYVCLSFVPVCMNSIVKVEEV